MSVVGETTTAVNPLVELDAREFGLHLKEGGWRLGLLVARCVAPGEGDPSVSGTRGERPTLEQGHKISATRFAPLADTDHKRVMRYYRAWERAAERGKVPKPDDLSPGEEPDIAWDHLPAWQVFFNPSSWDDGGATGPLNLAVKLGQFGDRLRRSHSRLLYFIERELPEQKPGNDVRALAGQYANALEAEAKVLRQVESGATLDPEQVKQELDPERFFVS